MSHTIIIIIPIIIPNITVDIFAISIASGINSKQTIATMSPDANDSTKLKNLLEVFLNLAPIIPPIVVPNVPKNNPTNVVFNKVSKYNHL